MNDDKSSLTHKEREHLDVLQRRLAHLHENRPERSGDVAYPAGEANALAWVIAVLEERDLAVRVERVERAMRKLHSRIGRVEALLDEDDEP